MFTTCSGGIVPAATRERGACYSYPDIESQKAHQDPEAAAPQASEHEHGGCEALTQKSRGARDSAASLFGSSKKRPSALEDTILAHVPGEPDEDEKPTPRSSAGGTWRDASSSSFSSTVTDDSSMSSLMQGHYCTQLTQSTARDQNGVHGGPGAASLQDPRPAGVVHTATLPSTSAPQTIEGRLGMVHIVLQLTCALELIIGAMDSCLAHAAAGNLTLSMIDLIVEQFEFVSSAMALHQSYIYGKTIPLILESVGPHAVPSNIQALYRMAELDRSRAHAVVQQLATKTFRRGVPCDLLTSARDLMLKYYGVCVHAAKIEVDDLELAACSHVEDALLMSTQKDHYATMLAEGTSRSHMIGLLFAGTSMSEWGPIGTNMGQAFPGHFTILWSTYRFSRAFEVPLRRLIESRPSECESVSVVAH